MQATTRNKRCWRDQLSFAACCAAMYWSLAAGASPSDDCADCHGKNGASIERDIPIIGGLSETFLVDSLDAYRNKERPCPATKFRSGDLKRATTDMCRVAGELSKTGTERIVRELAGKPFVRAKQTADASAAELGAKVHSLHCERCHSKGGASAEDDAGILAGQHMDYLEQVFRDFAAGTRPMPKKMKPRFDELSAAEKAALIQYYGSFR